MADFVVMIDGQTYVPQFRLSNAKFDEQRAQQEADSLRAQLASMTERAERAEHRHGRCVEQCDTEIEQLQSDLTASREECEAHLATIARQEQRRIRLEEERDQARATLEQTRERMRALEEVAAKCERYLSGKPEADSFIADSKELLNELRAALPASQPTTPEPAEAKAEERGRNEYLWHENAQLHEKVACQRRELAKLNALLSDARASLEHARSQWRSSKRKPDPFALEPDASMYERIGRIVEQAFLTARSHSIAPSPPAPSPAVEECKWCYGVELGVTGRCHVHGAPEVDCD